MALPTQGTTLEIGDGASPIVYTAIGEVVDISGPTSSRGEIDGTHLGSTAKEFDLELIDHGELTFTCNYRPGDAGQVNLDALFTTDPPPSRSWRLTLPIDTDAGHSTATTIIGTGRISGHEFNIATDGKVELSITIRNTGPRTITEGS